MTATNNNNEATLFQTLGFTSDTVSFSPEGSNVRTDIPLREIIEAHPDLARFAILHGMFGKLGNISKGGLTKQLDRTATDADLKKARDKVVENWLNGDWNANRTGPRDSEIGDMREAFVAKQVSLGKTVKEADAMIRAAVTEAFGKDEKATFPRFLEAVATIKSKAGGGEYDALLTEVTAAAKAAAATLRESRKDAVAAIEVDTANLF